MKFDMFKLVAITNRKNDELRAIQTTSKLETLLKPELEEQFNEFADNPKQIDFTPTWELGDDEVFKICPYNLPPYLQGKTISSVKNLEIIRRNDYLRNSILAIAVFIQDEDKTESILFQHFSKSRVIESGKIILVGPDRFSSLNLYSDADARLLRLADRSNALYLIRDKKLLFRTPTYVDKFLGIKDVSIEATEKDIRSILNHPLIRCSDPGDIVKRATPDVRKGFDLLNRSEILDKISIDEVKQEVRQIKNRSNISINIRENKIIFPSKINDIRILLSFLNHGVYRSPLTGDIFIANSMRKLS